MRAIVRHVRRMPPRRRVTIGIALSGTLLVTAYAVLAALQIIVLNPLAAIVIGSARSDPAKRAPATA